jgi:D-serine deaminase-like pyridoxal phosphate-dependent protein
MRLAPDTPYIHVHEPTLHRNISRLSQYAHAHGLNVRPHAKTHKSLLIGRWQREAGAVGLSVAKLGEAELFASACRDLLIAYPVVDEQRASRVADLAALIEIKVAIDSVHAVDCLANAARRRGTNVGILVDLDVGLHRTGLQSAAEALQLAQKVEAIPNLQLRGLLCYPGHIWDKPTQQATALQQLSELLNAAIYSWRQHGLNVEIVSGGSTPTAYQSHHINALTEIRPGTYVFNDMNTVEGGFASLDNCAARIITTVVSTAVPQQVIIDAGSKTLTSDSCVSGRSGFGYIAEYPEATISKLTEEHGQVDVRRCASRPHIGERLTIIPNHICPCINLQDSVCLDPGNGELKGLVVDARGKSR